VEAALLFRHIMRKLRSLYLCATALMAVTAACAQPQSTTATNSGLPPGLIRQGNVIMMQPIGDSGESGSGGVVFGGERIISALRYLSAADHDLISRAIEASQRGDWIAARGLADQAQDPAARRLIEWAYLSDKTSGASFAEIAQFLHDYPDWPGRKTLYARAETAMSPLMDPHAVIGWFGDRAPQTGIGKVRLGEALIASGSPARGHEWIKQAWIEDSFEPDQEYYIVAQHGDVLTPDAERERLEHLFAHNDMTSARREMARVSSELQRLADTRLALRSDPVRGEQELADLPTTLRDDPGILFDQAHLLRQRNDIASIPSLLIRSPTLELAKIVPDRWWAELGYDARTAMQQGAYHDAYALAAEAGLPRDSDEYAEAEFLAGWIALRQLRDPQAALVHFQNLIAVVTHPVSRARAHYWAARAHEAAGNISAALQEYRQAAGDPATFYGQLALARIASSPLLRLPATPVDADATRAAYEREDLTGAIRVLAELGYESQLREFAIADVRAHPDAAHAKLLAEDLTRMGYREVAVRVAKEASYNGIRLYEYSHPVISVPRFGGPGTAPDEALVLAIIRQETEFDPASVSSAGARGLMQVMPESAPHLAALNGMEYRLSDLTGDPIYNMELGMTELSHELADWGGSYVLAAAAYNAGPGNVRKWIAMYGDPRDARVDPVDWIEQIPFSETRNYVQRVLENVEVYRNRLSGREEPLQILTDLYRPDAPQVFPLRYTAAGSPSPEPDSRQLLRSTSPATGGETPMQRGNVTGPGGAQSAPDVTPTFKPSP
jgi:soluble lytic murein transglycosylase